MRTWRRPAVDPPTLAGPGGKAFRAHAKNATRSDGARRTFPKHWLEPDVQGALYAMQGRVCAYCGTALGASDPGDVDHFRPKTAVAERPDHGGYWWLAEDLDAVVAMAVNELHQLHEGNIVRFGLRLSEIRAWSVRPR